MHEPTRRARESSAPPQLTGALPAREAVLRVADVVCAPTAEGSKGFEGVAVLTSDRLAIVPGGVTRVSADPPSLFGDLLKDLWAHVRPALLSAFPITQIFANQAPPRAHLAARSRPGIEIPLHLIRRSFETHAPGCFGIELALPPPDPRPPFALYLRVSTRDSGFAEIAHDWVSVIERERAHAHLLPEIERPYALYYLLRDPPRPEVRIHTAGADGRETHRGHLPARGLLTLGPDGPVIGRRNEPLMPYEAITALSWSSETALRRARLTIAAGDRAWWIDPRRDYDTRLLSDVAHLISELSALPIAREPGPIRKSRVAAWLTAAGSGGAITAYEILHQLLHWL